MPKRSTSKQKAASKRNLETARKARLNSRSHQAKLRGNQKLSSGLLNHSLGRGHKPTGKKGTTRYQLKEIRKALAGKKR